MNTLQPNKHARFESRYAVEIVNAVRVLLRQHIGLDPMPSYRSIARLVEATYPGVKISGTTVKRIMDKLGTAPNAAHVEPVRQEFVVPAYKNQERHCFSTKLDVIV